MALLSEASRPNYPSPQMPQPARGDGPWGEAIAYWLDRRQWLPADLIEAADGAISKNTVYEACKGKDVNTSSLRVIASLLNAPLDEVLVSPARLKARDQQREVIYEAVSAALRARDVVPVPGVTVPPVSEAQRGIRETRERIAKLKQPKRKRRK